LRRGFKCDLEEIGISCSHLPASHQLCPKSPLSPR